MRKLGDLVKEEPIALTSAITVTGNIIAMVAKVDVAIVGAVNIAVGAWFGVLRWLVVPTAIADAQAVEACYGQAVADVNALDLKPPAKPRKTPKKAKR